MGGTVGRPEVSERDEGSGLCPSACAAGPNSSGGRKVD